MPYSGTSDPGLPKHVQKLSVAKRRQWVAVFNSVFKKTGNDGQAMRAANAAVKEVAMADGDEFTPIDPRVFQKDALTLGNRVEGGEKEETVAEEKCGLSDVQVVKTYGGAQSFRDYDSWLESARQESGIIDLTYIFRELTNNIFSDPELTLVEKSRRVRAISVEMEKRIPKAGEWKEEAGKNAVPSHETPMAPKGLAWDAGAVLKKIEGKAQLRRVHAWFDAAGNADDKATYKLPHHTEDGRVVLKGIQAAMGALMGARGGADIPPGQRRGAYNHLTRHYGQFDKEPPEFKEQGGSELAPMNGLGTRIKEAIQFLGGLLGQGNDQGETWLAGLSEDMLAARSGFKIFADQDGDLRWLGFSSNAFEDKDGELFTTKALEADVARGDASEERGPLRVFHVPDADIGSCDFQAVIGRFLVESGKFDETEKGQRAVEYFRKHSDVKWGMSIGYEYKPGDREDGVYDFVHITERSVLPLDVAANPWTAYQILEV